MNNRMERTRAMLKLLFERDEKADLFQPITNTDKREVLAEIKAYENFNSFWKGVFTGLSVVLIVIIIWKILLWL